MKVTQIYELLNQATSEILGEEGLLTEDLTNLVDIGKKIEDTDNIDNYVKKLVNHIGKVRFVNRLYAGGAPSVLMDSWEFGSILEKISADLPSAEESDSWKLSNGQSYDPNIFYQPSVSVKFFNSKTTFEIPLSFTERQVKESFSNANQMNAFLSMLSTAVDNSMTVKLDALISRTINNMMAETLAAELAGNDGLDLEETGVKAVNLLKLFNDATDGDLTAENALNDSEFIKFATYHIGLTSDRLTRMSTLFNVGAKERFTPKDKQKVVLLSDFAKASTTFLLSDAFNPENLALPKHDAVPYWQGSGEGYAFEDVSKIKVTIKDSEGEPAEIEVSGILGVIFDHEALGVSNLDNRVTTNYNPKAEFYTNFYKCDVGFFNDLDENLVVFFAA